MSSLSPDRWTFNLPRLTDGQFAEIGRVIVRWSYLEEHVNTALSLSLKLDTRQGLALTLPMRNFRSRVQSLYDLWEQTDRTIAESGLKPIYSEMIRLYSIRNALAHRPWWSHSEDELHSFKLDPDQLPFHPPDQWKIDKIKQASADIEKTINDLQDFVEGNQDVIVSLQDRAL